MKDERKTKEQLINELVEMRQRIAELEASETERKRAEEALRRSLEETAHNQRLLLALSQAAQAVQRARTPDEGYRTIGDEVAGLGYHALVFTLTEDRAHLTISHVAFEPAPLRAAEKLTGIPALGYCFPLVPGGFLQRIIAEGEATFSEPTAELIADVLPEPMRPLAGRLAALLGLEQGIVVPLTVGGETHGLLAVTGAGLTEADVPAMTAFASQAAIALENARLYQETVWRLKEAETLGAVTTTLTRSLDLNQVLQSIADSATRLIPASTGGVIHLLDKKTGKLIPRATSAPEINIQGKLEMSTGEGIAGLAVQEKRLINVPNVEEDPRFLAVDTATPKKSLLTAPLLIDGDCIGTLSLNSDQVGAFSADDEWLLTTLAAQTAVAVRNARLHQEVQRRVEELTFLNRVGRAVTSSLDVEQVLTTVLEKTALVLKTEACSLLLLDEESSELIFGAVVGPRSEEVKGLRFSLGQGIAGWVAQEGQPLLVPDVREDPRFYSGIDEATGFATRSVLAVPLKVKGKVIGVIEAVNKTEGDFSQADTALLSSMAQWAAIAIENAQLFAETQRRFEEMAALYNVSLDITARLEMPKLLKPIVERATGLLRSDGGGIYLYNQEREELGLAIGYGYTENYVGVTLKPGEGVAGKVFQSGEPMIIDDYRTWEGRATVYEADQPFTAVLEVPLKWQEQIIGVLAINADVQKRTFTQDDLWLATLFANQAAIAIVNARLYEQVRQDAETKTTLLNEVNHRVKNNLSAIVGLLYAERRHAAMEDQAVYQSIIKNMSNRVQGLATVHSLLSASEWAPLSLSELAAQVIRSSLQILPRDRGVSIDVTPSPVQVTPDQAHDLALVINELATNTVKHALEERDTAHITVRIGLDDDTVLFEFRDDGPGYPKEVLQLERHNVGFYLIQRIVYKTLRGELALHNDRGAVTTIRFKKAPLGFRNPKGLIEVKGSEDERARKTPSVDR
jgi:GAF domain-containing protein